MKIQYIITILAIATVNFCSASPSGKEGMIAEAMISDNLVSIFTKTKLCDIDPKLKKDLKQCWKKVSKLDFNKIISRSPLKKSRSSSIHRKGKSVINISYYYNVGICINIKGKEIAYLLSSEVVHELSIQSIETNKMHNKAQ